MLFSKKIELRGAGIKIQLCVFFYFLRTSQAWVLHPICDVREARSSNAQDGAVELGGKSLVLLQESRWS